jgi:hypothetical protein
MTWTWPANHCRTYVVWFGAMRPIARGGAREGTRTPVRYRVAGLLNADAHTASFQTLARPAYAHR